MTMPEKPYIDYRFLGIRSFVDTIASSGTDYRLFDDDFSTIFREYPEILNEGEDTIRTGMVVRDGQGVFFAELGLKLTRSYRAYLVFIFGHHPTPDDLGTVVSGIEALIDKNLDGVNIGELAESLSEDRRTLQ